MADDPQPEGEQPEQPGNDDLPLSQDEVDALLSGGGPAAPEPAADDAAAEAMPTQSDAEAAAEAAMLAALESDTPLTQEEVDALAAAALESAGAAAGEPQEDEPPASPLLTDDVLDRLFGEAAPGPPTGGSQPTPLGFDDVELEPEEKPTRFSAAAAHTAAPSPIREGTGETVRDLDLLAEVVLTVCAEIGRSEMTIEEVLKLGPGSLIELDKLAGEPVELLVNDRRIARGEVVVVDDSFGVRITELGP